MCDSNAAANDQSNCEKSLAARLLLFNDDLYGFLSVCTFYQEALRRLAAENELNDKSRLNLGATLFGNWVNEQGDRLIQTLEGIENRVKDTKPGE